MSVKISNRINKAKSEEEIEKIYTTCCVKIDTLWCSNLVEHFIDDYVLCKTHYNIQIVNSYNNSKNKAIRDSNDILTIIKKINIQSLEDIDNCEAIGKINNMYIYKINNKIVKFSYKKYNPDLVRLDYKKYEEIKDMSFYNNSSIGINLKFISKQQKENINNCSNFKIHNTVIKKKENIKLYTYGDVDYSMYKYLRYCNKERKKEFIIELAIVVKEYHKRYITIGHFSELNIAVRNNKPVFISFFSFITSHTEYCDEFINKEKCQNLLCDIITGSTNCLLFNFADKFDDLEMIMWLYLQITNHNIIKEFKDSNDNILSIDKIYKKKINFINKLNENGILTKINSPLRNKFNIVNEIKKIIEYFDS